MQSWKPEALNFNRFSSIPWFTLLTYCYHINYFFGNVFNSYFPHSEVGTPRYSKDLQRSHKYEINQRIQSKFSVNSAKFFSSLFFAEH